MAYTPRQPRKRSKRNKEKVEFTILDWIKLVAFAISAAILISVFIFLRADIGNVADDYGGQAESLGDGGHNSKGQFTKQYDYKNEVAGKEDGSNGENNSNNSSSNDKLGNYDIRYYIMFSPYEANYIFEVNMNDGGFGPIQETHSGLPLTLEKMYDSDIEFFSFLKEYIDSPTLYMKSCIKPHKWNSCRTYPAGSKKVQKLFEDNIKTGQDIKKFYDAFVIQSEEDYLKPAITALERATGKLYIEFGPGTISTIYSLFVRGGSNTWSLSGVTASMTEDEVIDKMFENARNSKYGEEERFKCGANLAKRMNNGEINIYGDISCGGECGTRHGVSGTETFGALFGIN